MTQQIILHRLGWSLRKGNNSGVGVASLVVQLVKNLLAMRQTWVRSLGWEDPLEKGKVTHSSSLAWRVPWTVQSTGSTRTESGTTERLLLPLAQLRELSELQLRRGDLCSSQLGGNLTFWPRIAFRKASRSSAKDSRWLWDPYPKTFPDSHHLRTNISFLVSEYSLVAFFLISPWLFLSPRTLCFNSISFSQTVVLKTLNKLCSYLQPSAFF